MLEVEAEGLLGVTGGGAGVGEPSDSVVGRDDRGESKPGNGPFGFESTTEVDA